MSLNPDGIKWGDISLPLLMTIPRAITEAAGLLRITDGTSSSSKENHVLCCLLKDILRMNTFLSDKTLTVPCGRHFTRVQELLWLLNLVGWWSRCDEQTTHRMSEGNCYWCTGNCMAAGLHSISDILEPGLLLTWVMCVSTKLPCQFFLCGWFVWTFLLMDSL